MQGEEILVILKIATIQIPSNIMTVELQLIRADANTYAAVAIGSSRRHVL